MITPKRQAKLLNGTFFATVLLGYLGMTLVFGLNTYTTQAQTASPIEKQKPLPLLSDNFLLPPTVASEESTLSFPITSDLEVSLQASMSSETSISSTPTPLPTATPTTVPTTPPDYCLDVPIVLYHHIEPLPIAEQLGHAQLTVDAAIFDEQMKYLKDHGYNAISSDDLINALYNRQLLPPKSIMITIDDGYIDNYTYAFLTAKKYQMMMNFMIPTGLVGQPDYMTWDHLKEMAHSPFARIYNHTVSHAALGGLSKEQIMQEVAGSDSDLFKNTGVKSTIVTYPYGSYNELAIEALKELHERAAFTTEPGRNQCMSNIMRLPRVRVGNGPMSQFGF